MTTIKLKNGSGAPLAGDLVQGEPALDLTNKRLYTENSGGTVIEIGTNPTSLTTGTFTSTGIDDNASSTAITIDSSQNTTFAGTINSGDITVSDGTPFIRLQDSDVTNGYTQISNFNGNGYIGARNDSANGSLLIGGYGGGTFTEFARWSDVGHLTQQNNLTVLGAFTSVGIDDNASSTAITISSAGETTFSGDVNLEESTPRILLQDSDVTDSRFQIAMAGATTYVRTRGGTSDYGDVRFQRNNDGSTHLNVFRTTAGGDFLFYDDDGSTEGMRWDSSVSRVGIGISSPAKTIDMQSTAPSVRFRDNSATTTITDLLTSGTNGHLFNMVLDADNAGTSPSFIIKNYTSEIFRFTGTGRLGIGESAPDEELHIKASVPTIKLEDVDGTDQHFRILENNGQASLIAKNGTSFGNTIFRRDDGTNLYSVLNLTSSGDVDFYDNTGATIGMRWDASTERLGIDDTSPASLLQVGSDTNANADAYITFGKRVASTESNLPFIGQDDVDGGGHNDFGLGTRSNNGTINFYTGNSTTEFNSSNIRMTIGSAGQIGIGGSNYGTSGQVLTSNGSGSAPSWQDASGGGSGNVITQADQFRLSANLTADATPISANLERIDEAGFAKIGTGMSVSSGVFTFPATGLYLVTCVAQCSFASADPAISVTTRISTDGGSTFNDAALVTNGRAGGTSGSTFTQASSTVFVNVTDTSNVKVDFTATSITSGNALRGNTDNTFTSFTFIRIGASQ